MRKVVTAVAFAIVFSSPAWATNGTRMIGFGPVQNSMGGASVGVTLDAASVLTNPAGISELGGRIDFGATFFKPTVKYTANDGAANPGTGAGFVIDDAGDGKEFTSDRTASPVPAFGLIIPVSEALTFGLGAYGVAGMGTDYAFNAVGSTIYTNYSQMRFAPGIAYRAGMFSVGATLNLMYSNLGYSVGGTGFGQVPHDDAQTFGVGATVGVKATPMKGLTVGAAYESEGFHPTFKYNTPPFSFDPDGPGPAPIMNVPANTEELNFNSPQNVTVGVGYRPVDMLLLAVDVQWINYSGVLGDGQPEYDVANPTTLPFDVEWDDQIVVKAGAEIAATPNLKVRLGYNYAKNPLNPDKSIANIAFPAIAEHHITAGLGWQVTPKLAVNVGGMYSPEASLDGVDPNFGVAYETTMSQFSVDAGLAYSF
jgi:long-chain fatty acid transport protein